MSHSRRFLEVSRSIGGGAFQLSRRDSINEGGVVVSDSTKELGSVLTLPSVDDDHLVYQGDRGPDSGGTSHYFHI